MSSASYHRERIDLLVLAVTSLIRPSLKFGERVIGNWKEAGLLKPSPIKPVIATIDPSIVVRRLGRLEPGDQLAARQILDEILGQPSLAAATR